MSPKIALLLCTVLIILAFRIGFKQKPNITPALWVPVIWIMYSGSRAISYWLHGGQTIAEEEVDYLSGSAIDRAFLVMLMVFGLMILARRRIEWSKILKSNAWILILFLYMGFSVAWSNFPEVSLKRWFRATGDLMMVLIVLTEDDPLRAIRRVIRSCAFVLLPLSVVLIRYVRSIGVAYTRDGLSEMWVGVTTHKNQLGALCLVCALFFVWNTMAEWREKKISIDTVFLCLALWLLYGSSTSESKTSILSLVIGISILMGLNIMKSNPKAIGKHASVGILLVAIFLLVLQFAVSALTQESLLSLASRALGRDATFTGRTLLWRDLIKIGSRHSIIGVGFGGFWKLGNLTHNLWDEFGWKPQIGHNGYIDVYIELGLVGLFLLTMVVLFAYRNAKEALSFDFEYGRFQMAFFLTILVNNISETSFLRPTNLLWLLFLLVAVKIPRISQKRGQFHS